MSENFPTFNVIFKWWTHAICKPNKMSNHPPRDIGEHILIKILLYSFYSIFSVCLKIVQIASDFFFMKTHACADEDLAKSHKK